MRFLFLLALMAATLPCMATAGTLRDDCWMWGHDPGVYDGRNNRNNIPLSEKVSIPDAIRYMGIPNVSVIRWKIAEPGDDYVRSYKDVKRVSWVVCGRLKDYESLHAQAFKLIPSMPNLVGLDLDDYFRSGNRNETVETENGPVTVTASRIGHRALMALRKELDALPRHIDLRMTVYADKLRDEDAPGIALADTVLFWTWNGKNIEKLRENFAKYRKLAPKKRTLLGIYMWDFGAHAPIGMDYMRSQLDIAHELYMNHEIDGLVFHCTPLVNKNLEAVEYARTWIAKHGEDERDALPDREPDRAAPLVSAFDVALGLRGPDYWAGIPRHPAVVNPVGRESDGTWISLAGDWAFTNFPHACGKRTITFKKQEPWPLERTMRVPGCWEAQGLGGEGMGVPHLAPDNSPRPIRGTWKGEGFYRRRVDIPASWAGKRIWLKVGGVRSRGWFYVNDHAVAMVDTYAGAWKYEITDFVTPGTSAKVVADVDNVVANRNGQPATVQRWGGLVRDVELEATPRVFIDDAWVRGDFDKRLAEVHVEVAGEVKVKGEGEQRTDSFSLRVKIDDETREITLHRSPSPSTYTLELPLRQFRPWSPEHPNLYWAKIELVEDGKVTMTRRERFGVRKLEVRGKEFYLNGRRFFFRGFGDDSEYPLTGISPSSRPFHLAHLMKARACGFNYVRLHTHCEVPEFFEAADEAGILVQPELSYYFDEPDDYFDYDPVRDAVDRWVAFRRHPSYAINSSGNEGLLGPGAGRIVYGLLKKLDPDRLVIEEDMGSAEAMSNGYSLDGRTDYCGGPLNAWPRGSYDPDRPFICHEYMNLCVKQDSRAESRYTGVWLPPATREDRARWLARFGLTHRWGDRLQDAQHALQKYWQKNGIEHARKDPHCDGYCYWTIADCAVFNREVGVYTAQGLFNPLWETKPCGSTPEDFAVFNSPTCILLDTGRTARTVKGSSKVDWCIPGYPEETNRVYAVGETISADFLLAHYGEDRLAAAELAWNLTGDDGTVYARDAEPLGDCEAGTVRSVLKTSVVVPDVARPTKAVLSAALSVASSDDPAVRTVRQSNSWSFWLFPKAVRRMPSTWTVVCAPDSPEAAAARASGKNLILVSNQSGPSNCRLGWWWIGDQVGTAFVRHAALGDFPHEPHLAPLHFRIVRKGTVLPVAGFGENDFIVVGEGGTDARLYLAAKIRPDGGREVFVSGLDVSSDLPESISLYNNLLQWAEAD